MSDDGWDSDPITRAHDRPWDLLVVGGGTAGIVAALTAAGLGADVLLAERERTGGDCLWTGCVPSKALLAAAHAAADARAAEVLGVRVGTIEVDFAAVMKHVQESIHAIQPNDDPAALRKSDVRVARGSVVFTGSSSADIDGEPVRFGQALIATGSSPAVPGIPGLAEAEPLTSDTIWALDELPGRLLVLGGGAIGCELGQALARLGSRVTIVEAESRVLPAEPAEASALLAKAFAADGIDVRTGVGLERIEADGSELVAHLADESTVAFDQVLVAVGRAPRTSDLGLASAGVELTDRGHVKVDNRLRTTNRRIWAAGDVSGHPPFTHLAGVHGSLAASNAVLGLRRTVDVDTIPRVTYTQPEVASFGVAVDPRNGLTGRTIDHDDVDRAVVEGLTGGFSRLVLDRKGRIAGACIVGPRAGESLAEAVLAGRQGLRARTVAGAVHAYPTWSDGVWRAALAQTRDDLASPSVQRITGVLVRLRRRWMNRGR